ncbi:MAG: MATE family efflux transporter [Sphaerochaeta sp.]|jgi:putative MATE family efflux protein|nr:MATE family efflux transporter [Sphaerochaeta sp.]MCH3919844.1 MATE family efflux transporter [Sphaerochaeta sp.]MCI2045907.1 MATE family efflux transporter [Sphaerochaeta sp.]MCI2077126.1 MATE family efflux transporter [Sphaerochaeta sp.]MCI2096914.1 MATE family efflux transporter [Sphaerochaeta sp.]
MHTSKEVFEDLPVWRALLSLSIPTIISQLVTLVYNLADTFFIGRTGNPYMVAGSSLVLPVYMLCVAVSNLVGTGGGTLISRLLGSGREDEAKKVAAYGVYLALALGACYSLLCFLFLHPLLTALGASDHTRSYAASYALYIIILGGVPNILSLTLANFLRSVGCAKESGFGVSMGGVLNIGLDPLFMFVLLPEGMEVTGAGMATLLSNLVVLAYFIVVIIRFSGRTVLGFSPRLGMPLSTSRKAIISVGVPAALTTFLYNLVNILINRLSSQYGDIAVAAIGIVLKAERLPLNAGLGLCQGMMPLAAYAFAKGDFGRMRRALRDTRIAGLAFAALSIILYETFAGPVMRFFIDDAQTIALGTHFLRARCIATPFMFLCFSYVMFFQAIGMGNMSLSLAILRQVVCNIPILLVLDHFFQMNGIIWTQFTADALTAFLSFLVFQSLVKKGKIQTAS